MSVKAYQRSFAGGEIASELFGRLDLTKNQTGLARCLNFMVLAHGPAMNRAGLQFVNRARDSAHKVVVIPFIYSTTQAYALEFGDQYMRVHTEGGTVNEASQSITAISKANPGVVTKVAHGYSNGDILFLAVAGMTELTGRYVKVGGAAANTFNLLDLSGNNLNTTSYTTFTSGTMARVHTVTTPYTEDDLASLHYTQSADVLTIVHPSYQQRKVTRVSAVSWTLTTFTLAPTIATPAAPTVAATVAVGADTDYFYKATAIATDTLEESLGSPASTVVSNKLSTAGNYNEITPAAVSGSVRYNVYKRATGGIYGYIGQSDGSVFKDDNITPDLTQTVPEGTDPFTSAGNYPSAVGYYGGRRYFAGTLNQPHNLWGTRAGTESNLTYSIPTRDDDRIAARLNSRQAARIRHIVPLNTLVLLTSGAEWEAAPESEVITPTTLNPKTRGQIGANDAQPVIAGDTVLYPQARGGRVREMKASKTSVNGSYETNDISVLAPHLFDAYEITSIAYTHAPYKTAWFVRDDGILLGLTYVPEHQVAAWHQHHTNGFFESVCAVPEGNEDVLYAVVRRTINGETVRNIECLHTRQFTRLQDAFFVDSGLAFNNTIAATLTPGAGATVVGTEDVTFTAGSAVFAATDVERYIHYDYEERDEDGVMQYYTAQAVITEYVSATAVKATIEAAWPSLTAIASAGWRMTVTTLSGLWHLVGEEVAILGDGGVLPSATVSTAGQVVLDQPASVGCVGLAYKADLITMPVALETQAFAQGLHKNVNKVALRVDATSGLQVGPSLDKLKEIKQRTDEVMGRPPRPITGIQRVTITPTWGDDGQICVRQENPLPATVVALVPDMAYGG